LTAGQAGLIGLPVSVQPTSYRKTAQRCRSALYHLHVGRPHFRKLQDWTIARDQAQAAHPRRRDQEDSPGHHLVASRGGSHCFLEVSH